MKKTLLAAALLAGFAGAASAQSSVTLYGVIDGGLAYSKVSRNNLSGVSNFGLAYGQQSGNRWGLRGVEDIGGGNRITFTLENGFDLGNGTLAQGNRLFGRAAWVGIENNAWGLVRIGRQTNYASQYVSAVDPMSLAVPTSMGRAFGAGNTDRMSNAIMYQTPNMSGFQAGIGYSFATGDTGIYTKAAGGGSSTTGYNFATQNNTRQLTLGAKYASGPFYVAASYDKVYGEESKGENASISSWNLSGSYDLKVVKFALAYGQTRDGVISGSGGGGTGAALAPSSIGSGELIFAPAVGTNSYLVGATIPVNPVSRVMLSWTMLTPNTNMKDIYNAQNQSAYNLGYTYDLSKRTNLYGFFAYVNNVATVDTAKSTFVGIGMRHQF